METENTAGSLLARVPGDITGRAAASLPAASADSPAELQRIVDVPHLGRVVLSFERRSYKRCRDVFHFWLVCRAESADQ